MKQDAGIKRIVISIVILALIAAAAAGIYGFANSTKQPQTASDGTSTGPALYGDSVFMARFAQYYPDLKACLSADGQNIFPIPGLDAANTMISADKAEAGEDTTSLVVCKEMTPQGIAVSDDYLFVSAYCGEHKHQSVIYVLDKSTGQYLKTLMLEGTPHVGGVVYVPESHGLWVATDQSGIKDAAQVSLIDEDDIESYDLSTSQAPIRYNAQILMREIKAASTISYYGGYLIVGNFNETDESKVVCYKLGDIGIPEISLDSQGNASGFETVESQGGVIEEQGIATDGQHIFLSESFSAYDSRLAIVNTDTNKEPVDWFDFESEDYAGLAKSPRYVEQLVVDGDDIYLIFEGASVKYRDRPVPMQMDRIIKIDKNELLNRMFKLDND